MGGKRHNEGKDPLHLIPLGLLGDVARVIQEGNKKYGRDDWKKGFTRATVLDSMARHYDALRSGLYSDMESHQHHAAHLITNCIHWIYFDKYGGWIDEEDN